MDEFTNQLFHADCLTVMKQVPDDYFDLILTDPPYGIGNNITYRKDNTNRKVKSGDYGPYTWNNQSPSKAYFDEIFRISKNQIIFGANHFIEAMPINSACWLVWDKDNQSSTFAKCELAWTSFKTAVKLYKYRWNGMIQQDMKHKETRYHPTQKPIRLMQNILLDYAKAGHKIFDPFAGSGSTLIAAKSLGLIWCGCEHELDYIKMINERLSKTQMDLIGIQPC